MKIIHLGNVPLDTSHPEKDFIKRHPGRWVLNHALAQKSIGLDVEIVTLVHGAKKDYVIEVEGIKVHYLKTAHKWRHMTFYAIDQWRVARYVKKLKPDFVHAHGTEDAYGWAAQRTGLPYCITAQGLFFQIIPTLKRKPTIHEKFLRWGENIVLKRAKYVIAKSEYGLEALREKYKHLDVKLIYNTYEKALETNVYEKTQNHFAFVGTITERKGIGFISEAFSEIISQYPNVVLHIMGNAREGFASSYENEQISKLRKILGDNLVLHGVMKSTELFKILDGCKCILVPSLEEMSGNAATEGIMRGCHVVTFETTGVAKICKIIGNSTIVPYLDSNAFTKTLLEKCATVVSVEEIENAINNMKELMSPLSVAHKHLDLYNEILSRK